MIFVIVIKKFISTGCLEELVRCGMEERQENLYSIGEAAEILGISVQTLRYYDKIKLLEPAYINPNTGTVTILIFSYH